MLKLASSLIVDDHNCDIFGHYWVWDSRINVFYKLTGNSEQTWFGTIAAFNQLILNGAL